MDQRRANFGAGYMPDEAYDEELAPLPDYGERTVALDGQQRGAMVDGAQVQQVGDNIVVDFAPGAAPGAFGDFEDEPLPPPGFGDNLAEYLDENELMFIAEEIIEWVQTDDASRTPYFDLRKKGFERIGVVTRPDSAETFPGCSKVTYPLIAEAVVQFNSRALKEIYPSGGPVKVVPLGDKTNKEQVKQADRVQAHMNYQLTVEDAAYFPQTDKLLWDLPQVGSCFKKVFHDDLTNRNVARLVKAEDLIVPYNTSSLADAPRYTHRLKIQRNDMRKLQASGFYRDVFLVTPMQEGHDLANASDLQEVKDQADSRVPMFVETDFRHTVYECHCDYEVPTFEDTDERGERTFIALPYIITVDFETRTVLAIRRNWKEDDPKRIKRIWFQDYYFFPGDGFYGYGYVHILGGLSDAATGSVRALLDSAAFANMQGGFKAADSGLKGGTVTMSPGKYHDVEMSAEELAKAFYTPPFKEPSEALFKLLGLLIEAAKRFMSTTEAMVGDAANTGPVGTTVALIEQGSQVYSTIHKRLHISAAAEFRLLAELNFEYLPDPQAGLGTGTYDFAFHGENFSVQKSDYDRRVDVTPVSDPNIFSATQRIAQAQGLLQMVEKFPQASDLRAALLRMCDAMRIPDPEEIFPPPQQAERLDPVSECMALLAGKPVQAFPDQNHEAHVKVLADFIKSPGFGGNPNVQKLIGPQTAALIGQHLAYLLQVRMAQMQLPSRPVNVSAGRGQPFAQPMNPADEYRFAQEAAQVSSGLLQAPGLPADAMGADQAAAQELAHKEAAHQQDMKHKDEAFAREQGRLDTKTEKDIERTDKVQDAKLENEALGAIHGMKQDRIDREHNRDLATLDKTDQYDDALAERAAAADGEGAKEAKEGGAAAAPQGPSPVQAILEGQVAIQREIEKLLTVIAQLGGVVTNAMQQAQADREIIYDPATNRPIGARVLPPGQRIQ